MNILFTGLVDSETEDDLRSRLLSFKVKWDDLEKMYLPKTNHRNFTITSRKRYTNIEHFGMHVLVATKIFMVSI